MQHALILLVLSVSLLLMYSLIYSISRFVKTKDASERTYWRKTILIMFTCFIISGVLSGWLLVYV
ncbi:hypothetical protein BpOF4_11485 [Alkalihalophilus pseudofirmus OF4]|uniref:Uncharacterized protein n=2 Tax=Alkalihalophilus TaxID=2893060 RepID=D3FVE9_ALKPO|nr:hypothetical protein BpOF4_11485 [Alkalihalophilus pseudofirmus OF4]ERN54950.1 hypothetical protein A33I_03165 [Alkalihalophilus marmarensis DSM 21297]OLS36629.1 hypothetical protein BTR22_11415 [Alkalihalophilus pseudofirmus]